MTPGEAADKLSELCGFLRAKGWRVVGTSDGEVDEDLRAHVAAKEWKLAAEELAEALDLPASEGRGIGWREALQKVRALVEGAAQLERAIELSKETSDKAIAQRDRVLVSWGVSLGLNVPAQILARGSQRVELHGVSGSFAGVCERSTQALLEGRKPGKRSPAHQEDLDRLRDCAAQVAQLELQAHADRSEAHAALGWAYEGPFPEALPPPSRAVKSLADRVREVGPRRRDHHPLDPRRPPTVALPVELAVSIVEAMPYATGTHSGSRQRDLKERIIAAFRAFKGGAL